MPLIDPIVQEIQNALNGVLETARKRLSDAQYAAIQANTELGEAEQSFNFLKDQLEKFNASLTGVTFTPTATTSTPTTAPKPAATASGNTPKKRGRKRNGSGMVHNMIKVMGSKPMRAKEVVAALEAENLLPESKNATAYVSSLFSGHRDENNEKTFRSVSRGVFVVAKAVDTTPKAEASTAETTEPVSENAAADLLREQGVDLSGLDLEDSTTTQPTV